MSFPTFFKIETGKPILLLIVSVFFWVISFLPLKFGLKKLYIRSFDGECKFLHLKAEDIFRVVDTYPKLEDYFCRFKTTTTHTLFENDMFGELSIR